MYLPKERVVFQLLKLEAQPEDDGENCPPHMLHVPTQRVHITSTAQQWRHRKVTGLCSDTSYQQLTQVSTSLEDFKAHRSNLCGGTSRRLFFLVMPACLGGPASWMPVCLGVACLLGFLSLGVDLLEVGLE